MIERCKLSHEQMSRFYQHNEQNPQIRFVGLNNLQPIFSTTKKLQVNYGAHSGAFLKESEQKFFYRLAVINIFSYDFFSLIEIFFFIFKYS